MAYTIKFPAKNVYGNFYVTLWTKAADNLDHQVFIEISIHLLKQRICIIHFLPNESMRCLKFFWANVADILYHRGVYRNVHASPFLANENSFAKKGDGKFISFTLRV